VLQGTIAQFFSKPNGGKTLFIMSQLVLQIEAGNLSGEDIFYINEDDNFEGFLVKCEIAKEYGFSMISSSRSEDENLRNPSAILRVIIAAARSDKVAGKVFVFDTLKKFVSVMDKKLLPDFFAALRVINANGGTVILLGHANKYLDLEGKLVYEGVSDIQGDIDIQYAIYSLSERTDERQVIRFDCTKDRGKVEMSRTMEYMKVPGRHYREMMDSLKIADTASVEEVVRAAIKKAIYTQYEFEVPYILEALKPGMEVQKTKFVSDWMAIKKRSALEAQVRSRNKLTQALEALIGHDLSVREGDRGAKVLSRIGSLANHYQRTKDGE